MAFSMRRLACDGATSMTLDRLDVKLGVTRTRAVAMSAFLTPTAQVFSSLVTSL